MQKIDASIKLKELYHSIPLFSIHTMAFSDFESHLQGNDIHFTCERIPLCIVNGIRRFSMNSIPIGGFRDDPPSVLAPNRSITIQQNHTLLYNEMFVTRVAMVPIKQHMLPKIMTKWDTDKGVRTYYWDKPDEVPTCSLVVKSDGQQPGLLDVTTDMMDKKELFIKDLVLNTPILLHSLMFPYPDIDIPFAFTAKPVIGTGQENSSFTPVGTTGMRFLEDSARVASVKEAWMNRKARERASKGLTPLSADELAIMEKNFELLEQQRVYKQDSTGPTHIRLRVESLGSLPSKVIVLETMRMMAIHMCDLYHSIKETDIHQEQQVVIIHLGQVDHTIPQLLVECWKRLPIASTYSIPSYELDHPLKGNMRLHLRIVDTDKPIDKKVILENIHLCIGIIVDDLSYLISQWKQLSNQAQLAGTSGAQSAADMAPRSGVSSGASGETREHTVFSDPPTHWNWIESLPLSTTSLLPTSPSHPPRTRWTISPSLFRPGSGV